MATTRRKKNILPTTTQSCPICSSSVRASARYPTVLCRDCSNKAADSSGRKLTFYNTELLGHGFQAVFEDDGTESAEVTQSHVAWVDGHRVWAEEAYFGGIVLFEKQETPEARDEERGDAETEAETEAEAEAVGGRGGGGGDVEAAEERKTTEPTSGRT